jgi:hypothetical protein
MPGAKGGRSSSPNAGSARIKNPGGRIGARTPGGNKTTSRSPNAGAAQIKGGSRGSSK